MRSPLFPLAALGLVLGACTCDDRIASAQAVATLPDLVEFGEVGIGRTETRPLTVRNEGRVELQVNDIRFAPGSRYSVEPVSFAIPAGGEREVTVRFAPLEVGLDEQEGTILHDGAGESKTFKVRGTGVQGCIDADGDGAGVNCARADCDDSRAEIHPGAKEVPCNGIDDDCDPETPDRGVESCANVGVDDDCDGDKTELTDGVHVGDNCDSGNPGICRAGARACEGGQVVCRQARPASVESCQNLFTDDDCNGDPNGPELAPGVPQGSACVLTIPTVDTLGCTIDVAGNTHDCAAVAPVKSVALSGQKGVAVLDLQVWDEVRVEIEVCNPTGWPFHLADAPTSDGGCGDSGTRSNDAELWISMPDIGVCENDLGYKTHPNKIQTWSFPGPNPTGCSTQSFVVHDGFVYLGSANAAIAGNHLFRFGTPDPEAGQPDWDLHLGLNRIVGDDTSRHGTGLTKVKLQFSRRRACTVQPNGTTDCAAPFFKPSAFTSGAGTLLAELYRYRQLRLDARVCDPIGHVLHVGDGEKNRGSGEEDPERAHDAELVLRGTTVEAWPDNDTPGRTVRAVTGFVPSVGCHDVTLVLRDGLVYASLSKDQVVNGTPLANWLAEFSSRGPELLRLGASDRLGVPDFLWHIGYGRAYGDAQRTGSNLAQLKLTLSDPDPARCLTGGRACTAGAAGCVAVACP